MVDLLSLGEPGAGWLPPSVVEVKEHVVEVAILVSDRLDLVVVSWDVGHLIQVLGSNLTNVEVDEMRVVSVDLSHLFLSQTVGVNPVGNVDMFVRESD